MLMLKSLSLLVVAAAAAHALELPRYVSYVPVELVNSVSIVDGLNGFLGTDTVNRDKLSPVKRDLLATGPLPKPVKTNVDPVLAALDRPNKAPLNKLLSSRFAKVVKYVPSLNLLVSCKWGPPYTD
ncbi:BQ2448_334 [Microbotryum intermedium]|uniref:BQ2448_334 protein n=1 Tax=Microbotryum intermedium TaxID=269621 RepID=A0A238F863_9BASI|nr:BQ2448_334 [Microbotryum intermedium]